MDRIKNLQQVRELLDAIAAKMSYLKADIETVNDCIEDEKLIPDEISKRVIEKLQDLNSLSATCLEQYETAELIVPEGKYIQNMRSAITQKVDELELEKKLTKYKRFLELTSDTEMAVELLEKYKENVQKLLREYTEDTEAQLLPYSDFVDALEEADDSKKISYMIRLFSTFENALLAEAFLKKSIYRKQGNPEDSVSKLNSSENINEEMIVQSETSMDEAEEIVEKSETLTDEAEELVEQPEASMDADEDIAEQADTPEETMESATESADHEDELSEESSEESGILITKELFDQDFEVEKGASEDKAIGTKSCIKDMREKYPLEVASIMITFDHFGTISSEMTALLSKGNLVNIEMAFEYLKQKGYARKYKVNGMGAFYCLSPKGEKAIAIKEVRKRLGMKSVSVSNPGQQLEKDTVYAALARIAFVKFMPLYLDKIEEKAKCNNMIINECFYSEVGLNKEYVFAGVFWTSMEDVDDYCKMVKKECEMYPYKSFLLIGLNAEITRKIAAYLIEKTSLDLDKLFCYSLLEKTYTKYMTNEAAVFEDLFESAELDSECEANEIIEEIEGDLELEAPLEQPVSEQPVDETSEQFENIDETAKSEVAATELPTQTFVENDMNEAMGNTYQMIANQRIYCATAYLRALSGSSMQAKKAYEQLAYAVNDPAMRCSYNSQKIFSLYSESESEFSKYLMLAAGMRNFFMSHTGYEYDYQMKSLYENMNAVDFANQCPNLLGAAYDMLDFKEEFHKGIDFYADYRVKDQNEVKKRLNELASLANVLYDSCVCGQPKNHKRVKRFVDTWKLAFSDTGDLALYLDAVRENDYDSAADVREYLLKNFISENCSVEYSNLSMDKLNQYIDECWDKSKTNGGSRYKSSNLMSDLRNNLTNAIEKVLKLLCEWSSLVNDKNVSAEDAGAQRYKEIRKELMKKLAKAVAEMDKRQKATEASEQAGAIVLKNTIQELMARIDGSYDERSYKYYYIDFLRANYVLLDEDYLPDMQGKFVDFQELSLANRVLEHSKAGLLSFEEMLNSIFVKYGDNYGSAELIMSYLEAYGNTECRDDYNIKVSKEQAQKEAEIKLKNFIEDLELAQSYGQIEETKENKKEKIQRIANEWFEYTNVTQNYGFFKMILKQYEEKIHEEAKVRGETLLREIETITSQDRMNEIRQKRVEKIREMIACQNYTVAEDLLARIDSDEPDEELEYARQDYLKKFIDEYDYNYGMVANAGVALSRMVAARVHNKDDKGAKRLIDNWLGNGQPLSVNKLSTLLDALGFTGAKVQEPTKVGKYQSYLVTLPKIIGRNTNYKHPIAAFGSKAAESGFRVVCLNGKYNAERLMEEFKNISRKNTLILLDCALTLPDRRILARKMKEDPSDNVFAVLDRVLLMFLVNNYNVQFINQILMSVMMPFSYYQPYIWDSSKVMTPEIFMGRKEELEKIESPIGVNIVYGGRQLGKSALLKKAKMEIDHDENNNRAVFIEIKGSDYKQAARKIGCDLYLEGVLEKQIDTEDWDELGRAIKARLLDKKNYIPYLLLLLDEADDFIESCEEVKYHPLDVLKDLQNIGSERFKFVIAGLHNIVRFNREALSYNSVLPQLTSITIKPFNMKDARKLLEEPLYYLGFRFPQDKQSLVSLILASTNYFPGLIQMYCAKLIEAMKNDYAGYEQNKTPAYEVNPDHIKKVLAAPDFMDQVREKFEITLKLDEDNMYYIIALLMAYLYHQNANSATESRGFSAQDIIAVAKQFDVKKVASQRVEVIAGLMQELLELNILRHTVQNLYLFSRYSFFQMMGTADEIEDKLLGYMED